MVYLRYPWRTAFDDLEILRKFSEFHYKIKASALKQTHMVREITKQLSVSHFAYSR
jgi:hypothetical protein